MTPKQTLRLVKKIADIKRTLAAEKRKFCGYDDSRGLRYLPTRYYLQLGDYAGGLAYTRWFAKSFPDDVGLPDFLFEWSVLLFKAGKLAQARNKVWQTYCVNTYVLDKFLGQPVQPLLKYEWSAMAQSGFADYFVYSSEQADLLDFSEWLRELMSTDVFRHQQARFLAIHQRLISELNPNVRGRLLAEVRQLETALSLSVS